MLTIHTAPAVRLTLAADDEPLADGAVAVSGERIAAIGPLDELAAAYPDARVRRWPGTLGPALVHDGPLPPAPTPRERIHAVLRLGAAAVLASRLDAEPEADALRTAAARGGLAVLSSARPPALVPTGRADLAAFTADGRCVATVVAGRLVHRRA